MTPIVLHSAISPVCPVVSCSCPNPNDRLTWTYEATPEATASQKAAADNVIATIPIEVKGDVTCSDFIARWTNAEYLALEKKRAADIAADKVGNAKNWDIIITEPVIDMNRQKVQSLKADLVTDGVLTQARADEIFS